MKQALIALFILSSLGSISPIVFAQDAPTEGAQVVEAPAPATEEKTPAPAVTPPAQNARPAGKPVAAKPAPAPAQVVAPVVTGSGADALTLLESTEGDYRSARIPGMTFAKKEPVEAQKSSLSAESSDKNADNKKGVLKRILPLLTVLGILIFLVLVYRIGKKKRKGNVFRRFP